MRDVLSPKLVASNKHYLTFTSHSVNCEFKQASVILLYIFFNIIF